MASPFRKGALAGMKKRRAARAQEREVMATPVENRSLYRSFLEQDISPATPNPLAPPTPVEPTPTHPDDADIDFLMHPGSRDDFILSKRPPLPPSERGEEVFPDQEQLTQDVTAAAQPPLTFSQAFKTARSAGKAKFTYDGKFFNTMERGESKPEWQAALLGTKASTPIQKEAITAPTKTAFLSGLAPTSVKTYRTPATRLTPEDKQAAATAITASMNQLREASNLGPLSLTSGYRTPEESAAAMMNNVAAGDWQSAVKAGYNHHNYPELIKAYLQDRTPENLQKIGDERLKRERSGLLKGGHGTSDSADYSVRNLTTREEALKMVEWLRSQGLKANLEHWAGEKKSKNAHIHVDGINDMYDSLRGTG